MDSLIIQCINARKDFFEKYYIVPQEIKPEVDDFLLKLEELGNRSSNAQDFEAKFAENGLQEYMNSILVKCTPKPYQMTDEDRQIAQQTANAIFEEDRERIKCEAKEEAIDYVSVMAKEELISQRRKAMIEMGIHDDYTRASNALDIAKNMGGILKNIFKKKKF